MENNEENFKLCIHKFARIHIILIQMVKPKGAVVNESLLYKRCITHMFIEVHFEHFLPFTGYTLYTLTLLLHKYNMSSSKFKTQPH